MELKKLLSLLIGFSLILSFNLPLFVFAEEITPTPTPTPVEESLLEEVTSTPTSEPTPTKELTQTLEPTPTPEPSLTPEPTPEIPVQEPEVLPILPTEIITPEDIPLPENPESPGRLKGVGKFFEIKDSPYLNISLESTEDIDILLESLPATISLGIQPSISVQITNLSLKGLLPNFTYHKYIDDMHNHEEVTSDENGQISFTQDTSQPHLIIFQTIPSTKFLKDNATGGDCAGGTGPIGTWNNSTKTCTLTTDVNDTIQFDNNNLTLDGNGHSMTFPVGVTYGIRANNKSNITVKNLNISGSSYGVYFYYVTNGNIQNITTQNNGNAGFGMNNSSGIVVDNCASIKGYNSVYIYSSSGNTITNNQFINSTYWSIYVYNNSHNNIIRNNTLTDNYQAVQFSRANGNTLENNLISGSKNDYYSGSIQITANSQNNNLKNNILHLNAGGIKAESGTTNNVFEHNLIYLNSDYASGLTSYGSSIFKNNLIYGKMGQGIVLYFSTLSEEIIGNKISGASSGIYDYSANDIIRNNVLFNNRAGITLHSAQNNNVSFNQLFNNTHSGIIFYNTATGNNIFDNTFKSNTNYGMMLSGTQATGNIVYHNNFLSNPTQAYVSFNMNFNQSLPIGGNHWSNWTTPDNNNDGIVDSAYVFSSNKGRDYYPWKNQDGWQTLPTTSDNIPLDWQNSDFEVVLTCKPAPNGSCDQTQYQDIYQGDGWHNSHSFTINTEGDHVIEYKSLDQNGSEGPLVIAHALLDKTPPQITGNIRTNPVWNDWYKGSVIVDFKATDNFSGVNDFNPTVTLNTEGENLTATATAIDFAGNSASETIAGINIDNSAPTTTVDISGDHGVNSWYRSGVVVTLNALDILSGVGQIQYSFDNINWTTYISPFSISEDGVKTVYYRSIDNVGNIEAVSKTSTTLYNNDFKSNYNSADWPDATFLPWFMGRPTQLSNGGIGFGGQTYYGLSIQTSATGPVSNQRWGIAANQTFSAPDDLAVDLAFVSQSAQENSGMLEVYLFDQENDKYIKFAANYTSYYNRPVQVEMSGWDTRTSGHLHGQYEWFLFRIESRLGKTKFSVIDSLDNIRWTTTYDTQINQVLDNFKVAFSQSSYSTPYNFSAYSMIDDLKIIQTDYDYHSTEIKIDRTTPEISASFSGPQGSNNWYTGDVIATLTASDNNGIDKIQYSYDNVNWNIYSSPVTLTSSGETTFYYRAYDFAGNTAVGQQLIKIDKNPPETSIQLDGTQGSNGWYVSDATLTLSVVDNEGGLGDNPTQYSLDGINWLTYNGSFVIDTEGETTIKYYSTDSAGNIETQKTQSIKIDKTIPTITGSKTPNGNDYNWNNSDVAVEFTCEDEVSGIDSCTPTTTISMEGVNQYVKGTAVDLAGNTVSFTVTGINIDKTTPEIVDIQVSEPNTNSWYNSDVTIRYSCQDSFSGVFEANKEILIDTEGENQSVELICQDLADNETIQILEGINIDKTPPMVTVISPTEQDYLLDQLVLSGWGASDGLSGVEKSTASADNGQQVNTTQAGLNSFIVESTDYAGNTSSVTVNYYVVYKFSGVLSPINTNRKSVFKIKQTVPVKFKLFDANDNPVADALAYLNLAKVSNDVLGDEIEADSTSQATEGNLFRYDSGSEQYIFNLNTKTMSSGAWVLKIYLDDERVEEIQVSLR